MSKVRVSLCGPSPWVQGRDREPLHHHTEQQSSVGHTDEQKIRQIADKIHKNTAAQLTGHGDQALEKYFGDIITWLSGLQTD